MGTFKKGVVDAVEVEGAVPFCQECDAGLR